ncbi:MAG: DUF6713 family protein [Chloroflexota bacterium]
MESSLFFIGLTFILVHEMDAIKRREWLIFPLTSRLDEKSGYYIFTALHIPLYLLLFWGLYRGNGLDQGVMTGLSIFFVVHFFLHLFYLKHPKNEFTGLFSWILILGAGLAGFLHLLIWVH